MTPTSSPAVDYRQFPLALLRMFIGWHFLYEGLVKIVYPGWSSAGYLKSSTGPFAGFFHFLGSSDGAVRLIDQLNIWGLLGIGLGLMLGVLVRPAALGGIALLALYYFAYPPLFGPAMGGVMEGHYLLVNKTLVELFALSVAVAFPAAGFGLESLLARRRASESAPAPAGRREMLAAMAGLPILGVFVMSVLKKHGWKSFEEVQLLSAAGKKDQFVASATVKTFQFTSVSELKGRLPRAGIGHLSLSRMILGGNLIGGWAHARDLIYASKLVKAYHHQGKIFETFALAEACGVNAVLTNPALCEVINDYWRAGGKIRFISDCGGKDIIQMTQRSIDRGAAACYIQGGVADELVEKGKFDLIAQAVDLTRKNGLPAGIGGHKLSTIQACVEKGLRPDFWMKTLHRTNYWSASPKPECDNIWCDDPEATMAYMRERPEPWIAFKTLAAGALHPKNEFKYAFEGGADFICVGMYDFQIVDDVNLALAVLNGPLVRRRQWRA
ncbi:MAG: DoxX family membrane protein [Acidobacteria bacterium]|nr:DoxX family membrane protein [Acidobacteriota bacterium]